jgi:hypothetical protein
MFATSRDTSHGHEYRKQALHIPRRETVKQTGQERTQDATYFLAIRSLVMRMNASSTFTLLMADVSMNGIPSLSANACMCVW